VTGRDREPRDYLTGSRLFSGCSRLAARFFRGCTDPFGERLRRGFSPRALCTLLAAAVVSNTVALHLFHREFGAWGLLTRGLALVAAVVGLFGPNDWRSIRESSFLMRWMNASHGHG